MKTPKEYQYTAWKNDGVIYYTAWYRYVHFLWRGKWRVITPMYQPTYEDAQDLVRAHYIKQL